MKVVSTVLLFFILGTVLQAQSSLATMNWESKLRSVPSQEKLREYVQKLSARPHHAGSPFGKENALWIQARLKEWGFQAQIETFEVLLPTPKVRLLELVGPKRFTAKLQEPAEPIDPTSSHLSEQLPVYNAYSIDGDVTAPLVYVNHGIPRDYEELDRRGISVKGAIVIARYGASWRGIKPKLAAEKGAVGCIIYSDPRDDGFFEGDVFPKGPYRNKDGAQRGSVMDMPIYPGDPLTPGIGATPNAKRLDLKEVTTLTKIPVLPISYGDAQPLLEQLSGPVAPESWRGALPITYHIGPGPAQVHLKLQFNWDLKTIYDVIGTIPGSVYPDEWIIRGNHHDAWVYGAQDPVSGVAAMLEEARGFGELLKQGWKPKRTILLCAWDAEEQALLGSTEWVETHADELKQKAVLYINSDSNGRGFFGAEGSHTLERFINGVVRDIEDPEKKIPVWKRSQLQRISDARTAEDRNELRQRFDLRIGALGSGSDYTAFLDHLGIASLNIGYGGEDGGGIYHSIYDDFYWYTTFSDKDFSYGKALAQTGATAVLRAADAEILPFDFSNFAETVRRYLEELKKLHQSQQEEIRERNKQLAEGVFAAIADPQEVSVPPPVSEEPPSINFAPLDNAVNQLSRSAEHYEQAVKKNTGKSLPDSKLRALNSKLIRTERVLVHPDGLPGRPWFKHMLYAPGQYTGYGVKTIPGVREAIERKKWKEAESEIIRAALVLEAEAKLIESAGNEFESTK